ncbi:MAG: M48 family metalloprotease [Bryobacterales bacterium]|nr:M48 family metalloprotease [Bryobacterales bacterium]
MPSALAVIHQRTKAAASRVCARMFGEAYQCPQRLDRFRVGVKMSPAVNAYIDANSNITVLSGLMARAGSEDEIAAVLAHEYAHGLMRHIAKKRRNATSAALTGLLAGAVVGAKERESDNVGDWMRVGANIGSQVGALVYSQAMENEADHLGLFILDEAGYNPKAASHFHMRMLNARRFVRNREDEASLLYIRTHPGHKERIQKLVATEALIQQGLRQPVWK